MIEKCALSGMKRLTEYSIARSQVNLGIPSSCSLNEFRHSIVLK